MNKKGFVWYLFQQEAIFMLIGVLIGLVLGYLLISDIIPISAWIQLCPVA